MTTVTWVQDVNGNYEVSSAEHLKQIMHKGSLYTDAGSFPTAYWSTGTSYIQTSNIDLLSDSTDIRPIGTSYDLFYGYYDGDNYSISNWSYLDSRYTSTSSCDQSVGLFGETIIAELKNIRLTGIFDLKGFHIRAGLLVGYARRTNIYNITCDFDAGTNITRGDASTSYASPIYIGGILGHSEGDNATNRQTVIGIDVKGNIDLVTSGYVGNSNIGGVAGFLLFANVSFIRNETIISGLNGKNSGGILGYLHTCDLSYIVNNMSGDITGSSYVGGIVGLLSSDHSLTNIANSMTGNISNTSVSQYSGSGGIAGMFTSGGTYYGLFNYMAGNITGNVTGGIAGRSQSSSVTITKSINAMNGNVGNSVITETINGSVSVSVRTDFGLTYTSNTYGTSIRPSGFSSLSGFLLPYFEISGTDTVGNSYNFDFVFANIGGSGSYTNTHLVISGGVGTFQDGVITLPSFELIPSVTGVNIVIKPVSGAIAYRLTSQVSGSPEKIVRNNFTNLTQVISNLIPVTGYTFRLYSSTNGSTYTFIEALVINTLANIGTNYVKSTYLSGGRYDLSSLSQESVTLMSDLMNDVFATGDVMKVKVKRNPEVSKFVNRGDTLDITGADAVVAPFSKTSGSGQNFSLTLSDTSIVNVTYDDTTEEVTVDSTPYNTGDSFILDGKKVTIVDI